MLSKNNVQDDSAVLKNIDKKLSGLISLIALVIVNKELEVSKLKPEVMLSNVGLDTAEIAKILGKQVSAVQKAIQRAKK